MNPQPTIGAEKGASKGRQIYTDLMNRTRFADPETMLLSPRAFDHDIEQTNSMLRSLSVGDIDGFVGKAERLGIAKDQAQLAVRDTAALGAIIMQLGVVFSW